ncbi:hypothetical protein MA16_Dca023657 [Dendrobium catenatum]|uniref:Uncharacterized protein n=1 Tax=Dendrobium catenatum TaxID=906689 RepID=A0A2I0XD46_9ASPA|nr:hypothetical protein MA16_Dca023657 [Dendrobium catenatum]
MEGGDEGLVKLLDSKDLQQQSKALDKLTDRVEDRQLDSTRVQECVSVHVFLHSHVLHFVGVLLSIQAMAALASSKEADWNTMRMRSTRSPWTKQPMAADKDPSVRMEMQDTPMTVQLGRVARIQLANAVIETRNTGATIHFSGLEFSAATARAAAVPVYGINSEEPSGRSYSARTAAKGTTQGRTCVFKRLSQSETLTAKRVVTGRKISAVTVNTTILPRETVASGRCDAEASSYGGRLNRRQRRKKKAELRAQQLPVPIHPSNLLAQESEINIPTHNRFSNLKWIKRSSSSGELKKSFWERQSEAPAPQKTREPERLSSRVHRVLKIVKEKGLMKKFQRPLIVEARRTPPRDRLSSIVIVERRDS